MVNSPIKKPTIKTTHAWQAARLGTEAAEKASASGAFEEPNWRTTAIHENFTGFYARFQKFVKMLLYKPNETVG